MGYGDMTSVLRPAQPRAWVIMPFHNAVDLTAQAVQDVLNQTVPVQLLLIDQGSDEESRAWARRVAVQTNQVSVWHYTPALSLAACWNHALQSVWDAGGHEAWVVNNDIRVHPRTLECLQEVQSLTQALFVTPVNTGDRFHLASSFFDAVPTRWSPEFLASRGGPDFSCFLITRECHQSFPFDQGFRPAYCEDLDYHRRLLLAGYGDKIFSVNIPYQHLGSGTLSAMSPEQRARTEAQINAGSRAHYRMKWGGDVNQERYRVPFDPTSDQDGVTTPELQRAVQAGG
jgi:GT2 family glycosyltransferase